MEEKKLYISLKRIALLFLIFFVSELNAGNKIYISFSMPNSLILAIAHDARIHNATLVLNGLYDDSMRKTMEKIFEIEKKESGVSFEINPEEFKEYKINKVPAFVFKEKGTNIVYGNIHYEEALEISRRAG